jgi:hypothetical protein
LFGRRALDTPAAAAVLLVIGISGFGFIQAAICLFIKPATACAMTSFARGQDGNVTPKFWFFL